MNNLFRTGGVVSVVPGPAPSLLSALVLDHQVYFTTNTRAREIFQLAVWQVTEMLPKEQCYP